MLDLSNIAMYQENNRIEAKKSLGGLPKSLWETYSAFANATGGILLLGVEEYKDKSLHIVDLPEPEALVAEFYAILNNPRKVSVNILREQDVCIQNVDGKRMIVIHVPRASRFDKPVYIDDDPFTGTYRRTGEGDFRCSREEVTAMMRDALVDTQDMRILETEDFSVFDYHTVHRYRRKMEEVSPGHAWELLSDEAFLHRLGAVGNSSDGTLHPTAAGLLMFGLETEIVKHYPQFVLEYQEQGSSDEILSIASFSGGWSGNVYDFYTLVREKLLCAVSNTAQSAKIQNALCEALANALIHADYHGSRGIVILKQVESVVFSNPGTFRIDVREAKNGGISDPRNAAIMKMFHLVGVGRGTGSGMPQIFHAWKNRGWEDPVVQELFAPNRTTLTLALGDGVQSDVMQERRSYKEQILEYLTEHVTGTNADFRAVTGLSAARVILLIKDLLQEELIVAEGSHRSRVYRLKA